MNETKKPKLFSGKLFTKLKNIKHIELIVAVVLGAIILLIYFSSLGSSSKKVESTQTSSQQTSSLSIYIDSLETRLENVLSNIEGAGKIAVMITTDGGIEYVYAEESEEKNNSVTNGSTQTSTTTSSTTPILVGSSGTTAPIVLAEKMPDVKGVVVVSSGAKNVKTKLDIILAVQTLLGISADKVSVIY